MSAVAIVSPIFNRRSLCLEMKGSDTMISCWWNPPGLPSLESIMIRPLQRNEDFSSPQGMQELPCKVDVQRLLSDKVAKKLPPPSRQASALPTISLEDVAVDKLLGAGGFCTVHQVTCSVEPQTSKSSQYALKWLKMHQYYSDDSDDEEDQEEVEAAARDLLREATT